MSVLIFCSFEVGAFPFRMAEILNTDGIVTYYVSLADKKIDYDSTLFHYGTQKRDWDLSSQFSDCKTAKDIVEKLRGIKCSYHITHCLATGLKSYLLTEADIPYHYWSYGADLNEECFDPNWPNGYSPFLLLKRWFYFRRNVRPFARRSICYSEALMIAPYQFEAVRKICPEKKLFFFSHYCKVHDYTKLMWEKEISKGKVCREIDAQRYFFSSTRHLWAKRHKTWQDYKGNEIMIYSFAEFLKLPESKDTKLVLVEKGPDVVHTKALARKLEVDSRIVWLKEMRRDELDTYYRGAEICFGQFGNAVITNAMLEPLANGTITVSHFGKIPTEVPFYTTLPPLFMHDDPRAIALFLQKVLQDEKFRNERSCEGWKWVRDNCSEKIFIDSFAETMSIQRGAKV